MIFGHEWKSEIYTLAKMAVQSFLGQTYPNRHLLIVNDGPTPVYTAPPARVIEMRLHPGRRLGQLRNLALEAIQRDSQGLGHVDYVTQWNDDDWSHPMRIAYQMDNIKPGRALLLQNEINCHLHTGAAFANSGNSIRGGGFPGTIIHPVDTPHRYPDKSRAEDTDFVMFWQGKKQLSVIVNSPMMYVWFYHGANTWPERHVMHRKSGWRSLAQNEQTYLDKVLELYKPLRVAEPL